MERCKIPVPDTTFEERVRVEKVQRPSMTSRLVQDRNERHNEHVLLLTMHTHFRISLHDENPSRANHDADPQHLRLHPCKHLDPHDKTRETDILEANNRPPVTLRIPHRHWFSQKMM